MQREARTQPGESSVAAPGTVGPLTSSFRRAIRTRLVGRLVELVRRGVPVHDGAPRARRGRCSSARLRDDLVLAAVLEQQRAGPRARDVADRVDAAEHAASPAAAARRAPLDERRERVRAGREQRQRLEARLGGGDERARLRARAPAEVADAVGVDFGQRASTSAARRTATTSATCTCATLSELALSDVGGGGGLAVEGAVIVSVTSRAPRATNASPRSWCGRRPSRARRRPPGRFLAGGHEEEASTFRRGSERDVVHGDRVRALLTRPLSAKASGAAVSYAKSSCGMPPSAFVASLVVPPDEPQPASSARRERRQERADSRRSPCLPFDAEARSELVAVELDLALDRAGQSTARRPPDVQPSAVAELASERRVSVERQQQLVALRHPHLLDRLRSCRRAGAQAPGAASALANRESASSASSTSGGVATDSVGRAPQAQDRNGARRADPSATPTASALVGTTSACVPSANPESSTHAKTTSRASAGSPRSGSTADISSSRNWPRNVIGPKRCAGRRGPACRAGRPATRADRDPLRRHARRGCGSPVAHR